MNRPTKWLHHFSFTLVHQPLHPVPKLEMRFYCYINIEIERIFKNLLYVYCYN